MKLFALVAFAVLAAGCAAMPVGNPHVPAPAKAVDLARYQGLWHEFARYENRFERGCEAVTAEYRRQPDGLISVINTCRKGGPEGPATVARGRAKPAGDALGAKLKVSFFGPFFVGDYWVLDHGEDYDWSIVGEGSGRYLWVLTREAAPTPERRTLLMRRLTELGYDTTMLRFTRPAPDAR